MENFDLTKTKEFRTWMKEAKSEASSLEEFVSLVEQFKNFGENFWIAVFPGKDCVLLTSELLLADIIYDEKCFERNKGWLQKTFNKSYVVEDFLEVAKRANDLAVIKCSYKEHLEVLAVHDNDYKIVEEVKDHYISKFGRTKFLKLFIAEETARKYNESLSN